MMNQENETKQLELEGQIISKADELYKLLLMSDRIESEELQGYVAEYLSVLRGETNTVA